MKGVACRAWSWRAFSSEKHDREGPPAQPRARLRYAPAGARLCFKTDRPLLIAQCPLLNAHRPLLIAPRHCYSREGLRGGHGLIR